MRTRQRLMAAGLALFLAACGDTAAPAAAALDGWTAAAVLGWNLRDVWIREAVWKSANGTYTVAPPGVSPSAGVTVTVVSASETEWSATATHLAFPEFTCGVRQDSLFPVREQMYCPAYSLRPTFAAQLGWNLRVIFEAEARYHLAHGTYGSNISGLADSLSGRGPKYYLYDLSTTGWAAVVQLPELPDTRCGVFFGTAPAPYTPVASGNPWFASLVASQPYCWQG